MKETLYKTLTVAFFIGALGSVGGVEIGDLTLLRGFTQAIICIGLSVMFFNLADAEYRAKRRKVKYAKR